jgi:NADPH:quinone reductase-like Zn-dependent oxidoreductase
MGSTLGSFEEMRQLLAAMEASNLLPVIDSVYPLKDAPKALARMASGEQFGKIVLNVG